MLATGAGYLPSSAGVKTFSRAMTPGAGARVFSLGDDPAGTGPIISFGTGPKKIYPGHCLRTFTLD